MPREPPERDRDLDRAGSVRADAEELRCAVVTQYGSLAAAENRRHPVAVARDLRPPNGIDAPEDRMQAPDLDPMVDRLRRKPVPPQLPARDDAMLRPNARPHTRVNILPCHSTGKCSLGEIRPRAAARRPS